MSQFDSQAEIRRLRRELLEKELLILELQEELSQYKEGGNRGSNPNPKSKKNFNKSSNKKPEVAAEETTENPKKKSPKGKKPKTKESKRGTNWCAYGKKCRKGKAHCGFRHPDDEDEENIGTWPDDSIKCENCNRSNGPCSCPAPFGPKCQPCEKTPENGDVDGQSGDGGNQASAISVASAISDS